MYDTKTLTRGIFNVTFKTMPETDIDPREHFDEGGAEIAAEIEAGVYEWFMVEVTASVDGIALGHAYLGGCCYFDLNEFMQTGPVSDLIHEACREASAKLKSLCAKAH